MCFLQGIWLLYSGGFVSRGLTQSLIPGHPIVERKNCLSTGRNLEQDQTPMQGRNPLVTAGRVKDEEEGRQDGGRD